MSTATTPRARDITAALRKMFPASERLATSAGKHPGEFRVTLGEDEYRQIGAWGIAVLLHRELGVQFSIDRAQWRHPRRGIGRTAVTALHTVRRPA